MQNQENKHLIDNTEFSSISIINKPKDEINENSENSSYLNFENNENEHYSFGTIDLGLDFEPKDFHMLMTSSLHDYEEIKKNQISPLSVANSYDSGASSSACSVSSMLFSNPKRCGKFIYVFCIFIYFFTYKSRLRTERLRKILS